MNILQLHRDNVYPPENGGAIRVWKTAEKLNQHGKLWLATPREATTTVNDINIIKTLGPYLGSKLSTYYLWNASLVFGYKNTYIRAYNHLLHTALSELDVEFDLVVAESPQVYDLAIQTADKHNSKLLVNVHNCWHKLLEQQLEERSIPATLREQAVQNLSKKEDIMMNKADIAVFQSELDRERYNTDGVSMVKTIPNGCDYNSLQESQGAEELAEHIGLEKNQPTCIFVGSFDYTPNYKAGIGIINNIAPKLPEYNFLLIGRNPPETDEENVYTPGFVDDLAAALDLSDIALCPLHMGSGMKLKMLSYLAAGLPIISTEVGIQGLPIEDGKHALVRDSWQDFICGIKDINSSSELRDKLSTRAEKLGKEYDWEVLFTGYDEIMKNVQSM